MDLTGREFESLAEHAGKAYLRYSFTKGTEQEVRFLAQVLGLGTGMRVLDVGCGPGRHSNALRSAGIESVGADISLPFLQAAGDGEWVRADARRLPLTAASFDAAICLCQGGFGLMGGREDGQVLGEIARVVRPGGRIAVSAFSSYFAVRHLEDGETFYADEGVQHEIAVVRNPEGREEAFDLWTTCFTPRELRLMAAGAGITVRAVWSVTPGAYSERPPDLEHPELLLIGEV